MVLRGMCVVLSGVSAVLFVSACAEKKEPRRSSRQAAAESAEQPRARSSAEEERAALQAHLRAEAERPDRPRPILLGMLESGGGGDPDAPTAPWGRDPELAGSADPLGAGGLGLGSSSSGAKPSLRMGATSVSGRLPPEVIQRIVRQNFGRFRLCYENGLRSNPNLQGRVSVSFTINTDGSVSGVTGSGDLPDSGVVGCVTKAFFGLAFPQPEAGVVKVTYPISFSPAR